MKELNTFRKALLDASAAQFDQVPEADCIDYAFSDKITADVNRSIRHRSMIRIGLIAAVVILLTGSVFAAVRFSVGGQVEQSIYSIPEYNAENQKYTLSFQQEIAAPDAPDEIKEFMVPSVIVGKEDLSLVNCFWQDEDSVWYPHYKDRGTKDQLDGKIQNVHTEWVYSDYVITISQWTAMSVQPGDPVISFHFDAKAPVKISYDSFDLNNYEIFYFHYDYSEYLDADKSDNYTYTNWFWTDGNYLYQLTFPGCLTDEERQAIFESLAPVEDIYDYLSIDK